MIESIDWSKNPLIPVVVQEVGTGEILMLAYTDRTALELSINTKEAHYFSRSKQRLWRKGEESGHIQKIREILIDCDEDSIIFKVEQMGVACHTGNKSCFYRTIEGLATSTPSVDMSAKYSVIDTLFHEIESKKNGDPEKSYTAKLFKKGENTIVKKMIEESGELTFAIKDKNIDEVIYECADVVYHTLVGLSYAGVNPDRVKQELKRRFGMSGIEEKNSRHEV